MHVFSESPKILGGYLNDKSNFHMGDKDTFFKVTDSYSSFLPVFNMLAVSQDSEFFFSNGKSKLDDIESYTKYIDGKKIGLRQDVIEDKKICIEVNDIYLDDIRLILNFTDYKISTLYSSGKVKSFRPIKSKTFDELHGHVFIVTIEHYNNPVVMHAMYGVADYFQDMIDKLTIDGYGGYDLQIEKYKFLSSMYGDVKLSRGKYHTDIEQLISKRNSYKIVTGNIISQKLLLENRTTPMFLTHYGMSITLDNPISSPLIADTCTDSTTRILGSSKFIPNSITVFIIDNENNVGDRYMAIGDHPRKILKLKNPGYNNGLYFLSTDEHGQNRTEKMVPIDQIDTCGYVYKSLEEARTGADLAKKTELELEKYRQEIELLKLDKTKEQLEHKYIVESSMLESKRSHEEELLKLRLEYEDKSKSIKEQSERVKLENDRLNYALKETSDRLKLEMERVSNEQKYSFDRNKYYLDERTHINKTNYEEDRYRRDTFVETIKTVGAVAGVLATGYIIYNKVNSAK